jgi:hypothetical protein
MWPSMPGGKKTHAAFEVFGADLKKRAEEVAAR